MYASDVPSGDNAIDGRTRSPRWSPDGNVRDRRATGDGGILAIGLSDHVAAVAAATATSTSPAAALTGIRFWRPGIAAFAPMDASLVVAELLSRTQVNSRAT